MAGVPYLVSAQTQAFRTNVDGTVAMALPAVRDVNSGTGLTFDDLRVGLNGKVSDRVGQIGGRMRAMGPNVRCPSGDSNC